MTGIGDPGWYALGLSGVLLAGLSTKANPEKIAKNYDSYTYFTIYNYFDHKLWKIKNVAITTASLCPALRAVLEAR